MIDPIVISANQDASGALKKDGQQLKAKRRRHWAEIQKWAETKIHLATDQSGKAVLSLDPGGNQIIAKQKI